MKNKLLYIICVSVLFSVLSSCEDHRRDYMDEFDTIVYFRNGGDQNLALFRTGEDYVYEIPVCKSGSETDGTITVEVIPVDEAGMTAYNYTNLTEFQQLPHSVYKFVSDKEGKTVLEDQDKVCLDFDSDDASKVVYVKLDVNAISELKEDNPDVEYRLAFQIFSDGKLGKGGINLIMLRPDIDIPKIYITSTGVDTKIFDIDANTNKYPGKAKFSNSLTFNMSDNEWDFNCALGVKNAAWLAAYNESNGTDYELLPASEYTLPAEEISFAKGKSNVKFEVDVVNDNYGSLIEYVIPLTLTSCSKKEFKVDDGVYMMHVRKNPQQIKLTTGMVSVSCEQKGDGQGAKALVSDNLSEYWHSPWSSYVSNPDPVYGIYVQIDLTSLKEPISRFALKYRTRSGNANGVPLKATIGVSDDGENWTVISEGLDLSVLEGALAAASDVSLPAMRSAAPFKYIRLGFTQSKAGDLTKKYTRGSQAFVSISKIYLYGAS